MRLLSARWVVPVSAPPMREGAIVLEDVGVGAGAEEEDERGEHGQRATTFSTTPAAVVAVGTRADLRRSFPGLPELRAEGALCPALVNAHAHLELSWVASLVAGGEGVVAWTRRLAAAGLLSGAGARPPAEEGLPHLRATAALAAARAAQAFGTAAIGDVGNGTSGWTALGRAGMKGVFFHELVGSREARTGDALADATREREALPPADRPRDVPAIPAPHAPYSVGPDLMRRIFLAAARAQHATTIHVAEDADEILLLREGTGAWPAVLREMGVLAEERTPRLSPTAYLQQLGAFAPGTRPPLLVHMVHADAEDRRRAREAGATVVLCPRSNLHIGGRLPDVPAFVREGVALAVGTDSLASVPSMSLWEELAALATNFPDVPPRVWLRAATTGGGRALGLDQLGSFAPGQRPGVLDVGLDSAGGSATADAADPERALVSAGTPRLRWMDPCLAA